ncbi:MAG: hypothetical protein ACXVAX_12490 [Pseudobdellovibrio sp.]
MTKHLILLFILLSGFTARAQEFGLNDVSVLFPMPASTDIDLLWSGDRMGSQGAILPAYVMDKVPQLLKIADNSQVYPFIKVVGVRIDPCFMEGLSSVLRCQQQIRMVWQPVSADDDNLTTYDASLHSFYQLSSEQFQQLVTQLKQLNSQFPHDETLALGVHPVIKAQGIKGDYFKAFTDIILSYVGEKNLSRVTFMALGQEGNTWTFGGFDILNGNWTAINIARLQKTTIQVFKNAIRPLPIKFKGTLTPEPTGQDLITYLIGDSDQVDLTHEQDIRSAVRAAFKIENPQLNNPGTVDCVSCHVAQEAKLWAINKFSTLDFLTENENVIYQSRFSLNNVSPLQDKTNVTRAFGYFLSDAVTSQRTINESAVVANYVNQITR